MADFGVKKIRSKFGKFFREISKENERLSSLKSKAIDNLDPDSARNANAKLVATRIFEEILTEAVIQIENEKQDLILKGKG